MQPRSFLRSGRDPGQQRTAVQRSSRNDQGRIGTSSVQPSPYYRIARIGLDKIFVAIGDRAVFR